MTPVGLAPGDVLLLVDVQNDFITGSLPVPGAARIVPVLSRYALAFAASGCPVFATRDWHPPNHVSFAARGGRWPAHCVAGTDGAAFAPRLFLPRDVHIVSKASQAHRDAYSAFDGTALGNALHTVGARRLFVGGLATDYCVLHTVRDALTHGFEVFLLADGLAAVDARPGDGAAAVGAMVAQGAVPLTIGALDPAAAVAHG